MRRAHGQRRATGAASARLARCRGAARFLNLDQRAVTCRTKEAAARAGVACNAALVDQDQQGVAVAIDTQLDQALDVSRALAFAPELLARARPIADPSGLERLGDRVA